MLDIRSRRRPTAFLAALAAAGLCAWAAGCTATPLGEAGDAAGADGGDGPGARDGGGASDAGRGGTSARRDAGGGRDASDGSARGRDAGGGAGDGGGLRDGGGAPDGGAAGDGVGVDGGAGGEDGPPPPGPPPSCAAIERHASWELCGATARGCKVVYRDGAGCDAVCAAAGLRCGAVYADVDGACAPMTNAPLRCGVETNNRSDFCVCVTPGACPDTCGDRACGVDACGHACGTCAAGARCEAGRCVTDDPADPCGRYPFGAAALLAERVGFGRHATGGDPSRVYHVTDDGAGSGAGTLRAALVSAEPWWIVFDLGARGPAVVDLGDDAVEVRSNKTIDGRGRDITIDGTLKIEDARNIVITDVRMTQSHAARCTQAGDVIVVRSDGATRPQDFPSRDLWLHHVEIFDGGDGLFDVRGGSRITVSWSHFHTHDKGMLVGMESGGALEGAEMELTFHHNFFDRLTRRGPQVSWGRVHFFNNYQFEWFEVGAASLVDAQFHSEANVYQARPGSTCGLPFVGCDDPNPCGDKDYQVSKLAVSNDWATDRRGRVRSVGDLLLQGARVAEREPDRVFTPSAAYPYTAERATEALARKVRDEAGPRVDYCR